MISIIKKSLGIEKLHPDVQYFLDSSNLSIACPTSFLVMIVEFGLFVNTILYALRSGRPASANNLFYRTVYGLLTLASGQLFVYTMYHKHKKTQFKRLSLNLSLFIFIISIIITAICISIKDYINNEQILVFVTMELFLVCLFMIKPYLAIFMIISTFSVFYILMAKTRGVSDATNVNFPIIFGLFIIVNMVHYRHFLKIANHNVINHTLAEQLRDASRYDFLTKLKNRTALSMDFENSDNPNLNSNFIVMLTDIDDFKSYNDTNGHNFGDIVLRRFASIMQNNFGKPHCYRYGGDEYLIVIPEITEDLFLEKINIARECIKGEFNFSGGYVRGRVSSTKDLHVLINKADKYLYDAKDAGKNQVVGKYE